MLLNMSNFWRILFFWREKYNLGMLYFVKMSAPFSPPCSGNNLTKRKHTFHGHSNSLAFISTPNSIICLDTDCVLPCLKMIVCPLFLYALPDPNTYLLLSCSLNINQKKDCHGNKSCNQKSILFTDFALSMPSKASTHYGS